MKISQSLLFAYAAAQGEDRWGSTDYYEFNYGFDGGFQDGGKQDAGIASGHHDGHVTTTWPAGVSQGSVSILGGYNFHDVHANDNLHYNGLLCWMCDFRLDLATEAESTQCTSPTNCQNAYARCLKSGMLMRCRGEQRTCMFEERRRHGVVYSVCTGCKQTDACVAHWRRNQRFTLPFMNFGDMSLRNLPTTTINQDADKVDANNNLQNQLPNHRPIYIDDECSTYQETRTESAWRATVDAAGPGTNSDVFPMNWSPVTARTDATATGWPFSSGGSKATRQFTGHRVNIGLSYSKFAYDGTGTVQLNAQLSQWESTCRWCCHARPDTVCNIDFGTINSSPFSTKCGNAVGTKRDVVAGVQIRTAANAAGNTYAIHPFKVHLNTLKAAVITVTTANVNSQLAYWNLIDNSSASGLTQLINNDTTTLDSSSVAHQIDGEGQHHCSLSNAVWNNEAAHSTTAHTGFNAAVVPLGIGGTLRFFQPFNIAQSNADYYNDTGNTYEQGPRFWMQMFQRTPQYDLSHFNTAVATLTAKFPSTGEGRNSAGMDKFAGRGNKSRQVTDNFAAMNGNPELQHFFEHQTDMISQENRDFFDGRARDAATAIAANNVYLRRWDNDAITGWDKA